MKRMCKDIVLDADFIEVCIYKCFEKKWNRSDVAKYLSRYSSRTEGEIKELIALRYVEGEGCVHHRAELSAEIRKIAERLAYEIEYRCIALQAIKYRERYDTSSHKLRIIGIESIKQQILDYVTVNALMELFMKKIGDNQFACIPGRGQKFGKKRIEKWIKKYPEKCKYVAKADIKKCYPSINTSILKKMIRKYVKNDSVIYLTELLIDTYGGGLSIGSYLSTWLCNFYLSFAYHHACQSFEKIRTKKNGEKIRKRLIFKIAFWMDDIVMFGSRRADVKKAMKLLTKYLKDELDLTIKSDWKLYKMGLVDTMGYKISRKCSTIRSKTFIKIRRTYMQARRMLREKGHLTKKQAQRIISFYGKISETNSKYFIRRYDVERIVNNAKRKVSYESKIFNKAATC